MSARVLSSELPGLVGGRVLLQGWVHRVRDLGGVRFLLLRDRSGMAQVVVPPGLELAGIGCEWVVSVEGAVRREPRAPAGLEVHAERVAAICPAEPPPLDVFKPLAAGAYRLDTLLDNRAVSLRIPEVLDVFRVQAQVLRAFRAFLGSQGFVEIATPKLVLAGAEGGAALFRVGYFEGEASLSQSPQFYKQIMVGSGLERVFEVGHAYRAEKSETSRHLTEFVSLDFEMGFIEGVGEVMDMLAELVRSTLKSVAANCARELERRGIALTAPDTIPQIALPEAVRILREEFGKVEGVRGDLDTEGEHLIGRWAQEKLGSPLVFVTGYDLEKRPAYTMPLAEEPTRSASFDLLYGGVEVATGGQRIHEYARLVESFRARGLDPADYADYLAAFRHGMPPHGGMGMGLERLTKQMLGLANVREACLFPRDRRRLRP